MTDDLRDDQKQYLEGFVSGVNLTRAAQGLPTFATALGGTLPPGVTAGPAAPPGEVPTGPDARHLLAQNRAVAAGGKLTPQEAAKRDRHPLDMWDDVVTHAAEGRFPKGDDLLAFKYHGLFHVAPAQDSYMCRMRLPGGLLTAHQFRGVAAVADDCGGGYVDVTTRANLQIREIPAGKGPDVLLGLQDLGIVARGAGADNIRNVTGGPLAGIDPAELIDTRPLTRAMHYHIIQNREMYGLPRKFNIAFDGGGAISALEDTNDVGFTAVAVGPDKPVPPGVYFRLQLGGISGHQDFAKDAGVILTPDQCVPVAAAVVKVFIDHGDRTDRKKARLKYLLDKWGHARTLAEVEKLLPAPLPRLPLADCDPRPAVAKHGHLGVHPQKQAGLNYVGVLLPVGRVRSDQARGLAGLADQYGSGTVRLTVWQNLILSDIPDAAVDPVKAGIERLGLHWDASHVRGALVACTGRAGCKFAAADTKRHALEIADYLEPRLTLDHPLNIHVTGCPNSCAQHYLGDIGLLGAGVEVGDDVVEGYHVYVGGGYGDTRGIGREVRRGVPAADTPAVIETMLRAYLANRDSAAEAFDAFVRRHPTDDLRRLFFTSPGA